MGRRRTAALAALAGLALALAGCGGGASGGTGGGEAGGTGATFTNPVIAGQQPDPTIVRDGDSFWLATTSRAWAPLFSLFHSRDLVNWEPRGGLLERAPAWAAAPFWAPELTRFDGQPRIYYTARLRDRPAQACLGVATAERPGGPYRDVGRPLTCPPSGAIDAFVTRDEHGDPYVLYRRYRDGGGLWARRLSGDGLSVRGPERLLLPATAADGGVVEGPALVRHNGAFVLLFAAGSCCRPPCDYREAAARSRSLLGPYERAPRLVLQDGDRFRCAGHGTLIGDGRGRQWLVHHAVAGDDPVNVRRSTLLAPFAWDDDGWPRIGDDGRPVDGGEAPLGVAQRPPPPAAPDLSAPALDAAWQWPWDLPARARQRAGRIELRGDPRGAVLARQVVGRDVRAQVRVAPRGCAAGIAGVGGGQDAGVAYGIELEPGGRRVRVWEGRTGAGAGRTLATAAVEAAPTDAADAGGARAAAVTLAVTIRDSRTLRFAVNGRTLPSVAVTEADQRAIRVALTCRGPRAAGAAFDALRIAP